MAGLKDYQISVYVANLGKYVEGVLQGAWITLPMPAERLQDTLKTEVGLGGRYEEYAIHDYEGGEGLLATVANPVKPITGWRPALYVISSMDPSRFSPRTGTRWEATR